MGGYLASREVLTAADRRQINYASGRYSADMCISRSHLSDGRACVPSIVLRFGRLFVVFSPSASGTLRVAGGRSLSVTHPHLSLVFCLGRGFSAMASREPDRAPVILALTPCQLSARRDLHTWFVPLQ